jgi:hypothetical protein
MLAKDLLEGQIDFRVEVFCHNVCVLNLLRKDNGFDVKNKKDHRKKIR